MFVVFRPVAGAGQGFSLTEEPGAVPVDPREGGSPDLDVECARSIEGEGDNAVIVDELVSGLSRDQIREEVMNVDEELVNIEPDIELVEGIRTVAPPRSIKCRRCYGAVRRKCKCQPQ